MIPRPFNSPVTITACVRRNVTSSRALLFVAAAIIAASFDLSAAPRLAVVVSADQFRGDYLNRFSEHYVEGGFRRFLDHGMVYTDCHYRHSNTSTGPGHSVILTGAYPNVTGITGNDWLDREQWKPVYVVADPDATLTGLPDGVVLEAGSGRSPKNLLVSTVGDELKMRLGAGVKVYGVAHKDRAAILMSGKMADGAYWIDGARFVSSSYYMPDVPGWVRAFNDEKFARSYFGQTWDRLLPAEVYEEIQGPDDGPGEATPHGTGRTFPHILDGGSPTISNAFYGAFGMSPFENDVVTDFARQLITNEELGQDDTTDILCLGFSQIDAIGHAFGPDSHELMDSVLRLDRTLAGLFSFLDDQVGRENYVVVFTADHGVAPIPERILALRPDFPAGRVNVQEMNAAVATALTEAYGSIAPDESWFVGRNYGLHLTPSVLQSKGVEASAAARTVKEALEDLPFIEDVFTREEILTIPDDGDGIPSMVRRSYFSANDRDVAFILKPYYIMHANAGTTHGSPHPYDTHVPMAWFGGGIPTGRHIERVGVDDLAPTLAAILGIPPPASAHGKRLF